MIRRGLISATLRLNRRPGLRRLTALPYDACLTALAGVCARIPSVRSLYIPRDYHARAWMPGSSDLDLLLVLHDDDPPELQARSLAHFWRELRALGRVFPFLSTAPGTVPVFTGEDLALPHFGWRAMALHANAPPRSWTLLFGEEVRHLIRSWEPSPPLDVPASPDLLGLLDKHLHPKLWGGAPAPAGYLGSELRLARKMERCLRHLQGSEGMERLDPDGGLGRLMDRLDLADGFCPTPEAVGLRMRLGFHLLWALDRYNAGLLDLRGAAPLPPGQVSPPALASGLAGALARGLPASVSALVYPRSHLLGPGGPIHDDPALGLCLLLTDEDPDAHARTMAVVGRLVRSTRARIQPRIMGPHTWGPLMGLCGTNYALESFHLRRTHLPVGNRPAPPDPGTPAHKTLRLAMDRRLTVERCHVLRSDLDHHLGRPFARCLNPLLSLASYRIYLAGAAPLTVASEILEAHGRAFPDETLTRTLAGLARVSPAAPINRALLHAYRGASLDMLDRCRALL